MLRAGAIGRENNLDSHDSVCFMGKAVPAARGTKLSQQFLIRVLQIGWRASRRHCPNCGGGKLFQGWFRMVPNCPTCGMALERHEEGYQVGAYMFNMIAAELVFAALLVGVLAMTWPTPPWQWITVVTAVLMVILPIAFYPFSKTLFLGFDLIFRPAESSDDIRVEPDAPAHPPSTK